MKTSVVIPVYNEEKYIEKCLISLSNQIDKPDEIIVVDNNCTDKTVDIVKKYKVKIIKEKNQGIVHARNKGFNSARYDIIARCDADSVLPTDWIARIKKNFEKYSIDALSCPIFFYDLPLKKVPYANFFLDLYPLIRPGEEMLIGPNMALTKKVWNKVKNKICLDDRAVHEDIDLAIHIIKEGGKIKRDQTLIIGASGRRIKFNPISFFVEYPIRLIKMLRTH